MCMQEMTIRMLNARAGATRMGTGGEREGGVKTMDEENEKAAKRAETRYGAWTIPDDCEQAWAMGTAAGRLSVLVRETRTRLENLDCDAPFRVVFENRPEEGVSASVDYGATCKAETEKTDAGVGRR
jgi:hypothetical protein